MKLICLFCVTDIEILVKSLIGHYLLESRLLYDLCDFHLGYCIWFLLLF
jgi:hypothetical protein